MSVNLNSSDFSFSLSEALSLPQNIAAAPAKMTCSLSSFLSFIHQFRHDATYVEKLLISPRQHNELGSIWQTGGPLAKERQGQARRTQCGPLSAKQWVACARFDLWRYGCHRWGEPYFIRLHKIMRTGARGLDGPVCVS